MAYDELHSTLSVVYADHSLITWDVSDLSRVSILSSHNYHSACIWAVDTYQGDLTSGSTLVTCSNDDTIRIWSLDLGPLSNSSLECHLQKAIKIQNNEGLDSDKAGVKCVKVNSGENFIASGDRHGNIRVHNTTNYEEICKIEAHDAEIMSLQFAPGDKYLASGSRDRLIHLFDVENQFEFLTTVEEHSSCVTSVDFLSTGEDDFLVSSGADRSIISRKVVKDDGQVSVTRCQHIVCKTVPYDMVVGGSQPPNRIMVACQDRAVRSYPSDCPNSKPKLMKGSASDDGTLYKMTLDRSGSYYATSCSDKTIAVFNYQTGEMISTLVGHSDLVTGLVFSHDCQFLISVSGDSCIFVWRLPKKVSNTMASKLNMSTLTDDTQCCPEETKDEEFGSPSKIFDNVEESLSPDPSYRFSVGKLPIWARKKVLPDCQSSKSSSTSVQSPRGKWATKVVDNEDSEVNVLSRFEEQDDEPKIGSVEKTKKHLFCTDDDNEEFQVNAIDAETLRKSQKELSLPPSLETSASCQDDDDTNTSASFCDKPDCVLNINICEDDSSTEVSRKLTSISKAWREGTTPVQQRKQGVSIGKLLATNQLHALLQNVTPAKSPILSVNKEVSPRENSAKTLCHKPELSDVTFTQKLDAESDTMTRETIRVSSN